MRSEAKPVPAPMSRTSNATWKAASNVVETGRPACSRFLDFVMRIIVEIRFMPMIDVAHVPNK